MCLYVGSNSWTRVVVSVMLYLCILVLSSFLISVYMFMVSKALLISSATVNVFAGGSIRLNPFTTTLFTYGSLSQHRTNCLEKLPSKLFNP